MDSEHPSLLRLREEFVGLCALMPLVASGNAPGPSKMTVATIAIEETPPSDEPSPSKASVAPQEQQRGRFHVTAVASMAERSKAPQFRSVTPAGDVFWMDRADVPRTPSPMDAALLIKDTEPIIESSSQYLGSDEPLDLVFNSQPVSEESAITIAQRWKSLVKCYTTCSASVAGSLLTIPVLLLLLGLSCWTLYTGIEHVDKCDFMPDLPILIAFLGSSSILTFFSGIIYLLSKSFTQMLFQSYRHLTSAGIFIFVFIFILESCLYFSTEDGPSITPGPLYCDPVFYNFVYLYNFVSLLIMIALTIVYIPAAFCQTYEYPPF